MAEEATVSQVLPDGSTTALTPEADASGHRPVDGFDAHYEKKQAEDAALTKRLEEIFDKNHPDGGAEGKALPVDSDAKAPEVKTTEQPRDEAGKFLPKDASKPMEGKDAKTDDKITGDKPDEKAAGQETATTPLPRSWSPEERELWESIPPAAQKKFAQREIDAHRTISTQGQVLASYAPLVELLKGSQDVFARHNAPPTEGIRRLIEVQRRLDSDPAQTVAAIIKAYRVPLRNLVSALGIPKLDQNGQPIPPDPKDVELDRLKGTVDQITRREQDRARAIQLARAQQLQTVTQQERHWQQQVDSDVESWGADKPYFHQVREDMAHFVESGKANNLDEAYDMACNAHPTIRAKLTAEKAAAEAKEREDAERKAREKAAAEAKRVSSIQLNGSQRRTSSSKPAGGPFDNSYLEGLYDRIQSA